MDTASITHDIAAYLVARDDIAEATATDFGVILVRTQGGKGYTVSVENGSDRSDVVVETATD